MKVETERYDRRTTFNLRTTHSKKKKKKKMVNHGRKRRFGQGNYKEALVTGGRDS